MIPAQCTGNSMLKEPNGVKGSNDRRTTCNFSLPGAIRKEHYQQASPDCVLAAARANHGIARELQWLAKPWYGPEMNCCMSAAELHPDQYKMLGALAASDVL